MAAGTIAVHHYVACAMQMRGVGVYIFPAGHPCSMVWVYATYVVLESIVLYLAAAIRREALETQAIARFGERVMETGVIDLRAQEGDGLRSAALERLLGSLNQAARQAGTTARGMSVVSGDVTAASGRILIAGEEQQRSSESAVSAVRRMAGTAEDVTRHCREIASVVCGSVEVVEQGRRTMKDTAKIMESLVTSVQNVSRAMDGLHGESTRIEGIIRIMSDMARQTGLLALNATIEAAGAQHGEAAFLSSRRDPRLLLRCLFYTDPETACPVSTCICLERAGLQSRR